MQRARAAAPALLALVLAACRGSGTTSTPTPERARGAPATVQEAMECARSLVSDRGFSDVDLTADGLAMTAQVPLTGTERRASGGIVRLRQVVVVVGRVDADGYPVIRANGSGSTKEYQRRAEAAAADVRYACPTRLGVRAPARPPGPR